MSTYAQRQQHGEDGIECRRSDSSFLTVAAVSGSTSDCQIKDELEGEAHQISKHAPKYLREASKKLV